MTFPSVIPKDVAGIAKVLAEEKIQMIQTPAGTPRSFDADGAQGGSSQLYGVAGHALGLTGQGAYHIWQYASSLISGKECAQRLFSSACGTIGGFFIEQGVTALVARAGKSFGFWPGFVCQIAGNAVGSYLASKFISWLESLFQERPEDGYLRACEELGIAPDSHRKQIKRAYAAFHPDKGSGLSNEEFSKKTIAFELAKAWRNQQNTWDDEDD